MTTSTTPRRTLRPWHSGIALLLVGAVVVVIGLLQTTTAQGGNEDCPTGTYLVAKFEYQGGGYVPESGAGIVSISNGTATGGNWTSTVPIAAIVVKGGTGAFVTSYDPAASSGTFSNAGLPPVGAGGTNIPDISNVKFCGRTQQETTTTQEVTTTVEVTTTTGEATTTSAGATTTTTPGATTTTPTTTPGATTTVVTVPETTTSVAQLSPVTSTSLVSSSGGSLPSTGSPSALLITIGAILMAAGLTLTVVGRARDRQAS